MTAWRVEVGELSLAEEELTVAEATAISRLAGGGWETIDPLHSPSSAWAIAVTLLVVRGGVDEEAAMLIVNAMPAADLLACVKA